MPVPPARASLGGTGCLSMDPQVTQRWGPTALWGAVFTITLCAECPPCQAPRLVCEPEQTKEASTDVPSWEAKCLRPAMGEATTTGGLAPASQEEVSHEASLPASTSGEVQDYRLAGHTALSISPGASCRFSSRPV